MKLPATLAPVSATVLLTRRREFLGGEIRSVGWGTRLPGNNTNDQQQCLKKRRNRNASRVIKANDFHVS